MVNNNVTVKYYTKNIGANQYFELTDIQVFGLIKSVCFIVVEGSFRVFLNSFFGFEGLRTENKTDDYVDVNKNGRFVLSSPEGFFYKISNPKFKILNLLSTDSIFILLVDVVNEQF